MFLGSSCTQLLLPTRIHPASLWVPLEQRESVEVSPSVKVRGDVTPSGVWSQKIGSERMCPVVADISCRFCESLGFLGECRHHSAEPGGQLRYRGSEVTPPPAFLLELVTTPAKWPFPFLKQVLAEGKRLSLCSIASRQRLSCQDWVDRSVVRW